MLKQDYWQKITFNEICKNVSTRVDDPKNSGYDKYVGLEHLDTLEPKITRFGSTQDIKSSMTLFKNEQILFGRRNWYLRRVATADFDGVCSADIYVLEPQGCKIVHEFLIIFMHSNQFFDETMKYSVGSMSTRVKWSNLSKAKFLIPSIPEQEKIINLISNIDGSITKTRQLLEKLKIYKNSKANELLTKGIGHTRFKKVRLIFGKYEEIPETWKLQKLGELTKVTDGSHYSPEKVSTGFPLATVENVKGDFIDIDSCYRISKEDYEQLVKDGDKPDIGDVLFTKDGTVGKTLVFNQKIDLVLLSSIAIIRRSEKLDSDYCNYLLQSKFMVKHLAKFFGGTAIKRIILKHLDLFEFPLPPIIEQQKIASVLSKIDEQIKYLEIHLSKLKTMRKTIINEKLTLPKLEEKPLVQ